MGDWESRYRLEQLANPMTDTKAGVLPTLAEHPLAKTFLEFTLRLTAARLAAKGEAWEIPSWDKLIETHWAMDDFRNEALGLEKIAIDYAALLQPSPPASAEVVERVGRAMPQSVADAMHSIALAGALSIEQIARQMDPRAFEPVSPDESRSNDYAYSERRRQKEYALKNAERAYKAVTAALKASGAAVQVPEWGVKDVLAIQHPKWGPCPERGALEYALRDAYAAGCGAAHSRSLVTAQEYAKREAPNVAAMLAAAPQKQGA